MLNRLGAILSFIASIPAWILALCSAVFLSMFDLGKDVLCWLFDQSLSLVVYIIVSIDIGSVSFDVNQYWSMLPETFVNVMGYLYIPQAMSMIFVAVGIRIVLQLIPFVRLGS